MRILILLLLAFSASGQTNTQTIVLPITTTGGTDSIVIPLLNGQFIRFMQPIPYYSQITGTDSLVARSSTTKQRGLLSPFSLPVSTATQNALNLKQNIPTVITGSVTQLTSKATAVILNANKGQITMNSAALAAGAEVSFTLNNSFISATDVVIVNIQSVGTVNSYSATVSAVSAGSCAITLSNLSTASLSQALVLNFLIIK